MRIVPAATPVCSARSLIASFFTGARDTRTAPRPIRIPDPPGSCNRFHAQPDPILVTGATGYVGSQLVDALRARGHDVRTLSRRGAGAGDARTGDVLSGDGPARGARRRQDRVLPRALDGRAAATSPPRTARPRSNFAEAAKPASSASIYLGGLGSEDSEHLRSRHEVARAAARPPARAPRLRARGDDHRPRQRLLRHPRAPRQAAAGDDRPALAGHAARSRSRCRT